MNIPAPAPLTSHGPPVTGEAMTAVPDPDFSRTLLAIAHPEFRFTYQLHRTDRKLRWTAVRKDIRAPGVHTVITPDVGELLDLLGPPCWWNWETIARLTRSNPGTAGA
jgi:hypothetical protein